MSLPPPPLTFTPAAEPDPPIGRLRLLWRLLTVAREAYPGVSPRACWGVVKLLGHKLRWLGSLRSWHSDASNPALREMLAHRPSLVLAVGRPYINDRWPVSRRLDAIWEHYSLLGGPLAFLRFDPGAQLLLATVETDVMPLRVVLDKPGWIACEGELAVNLYSGEQRLYSLAFSLGRDGGERVSYIGALQGLGDAKALEIYRSLTHGMHGMRPRDLLLAVFRMLCSELGVARIRAVSDEYSACRSSYFAKTIPTSYDSAWIDHDGAPDGGGFYELAPRVSRRPRESIPSRKRAQYRRRYEMFDSLEQQIGDAVRTAQARAVASAPAPYRGHLDDDPR
jgi:uncharacterized protein VirK/YbjX